jgi:hypothetical protein
MKNDRLTGLAFLAIVSLLNTLQPWGNFYDLVIEEVVKMQRLNVTYK